MSHLTEYQTADRPLEGCDRCTCGAKYYDQLKSGVWMCASCKDEVVVLFASIYEVEHDSNWIAHDTYESAVAEAQAWSGEDWYHEAASDIISGESDAQRIWTGVMRVVLPATTLYDEDYNAVWDAIDTVWEDNVTVVSEVVSPSLVDAD